MILVSVLLFIAALIIAYDAWHAWQKPLPTAKVAPVPAD
jgi:hypothetical protein